MDRNDERIEGTVLIILIINYIINNRKDEVIDFEKFMFRG